MQVNLYLKKENQRKETCLNWNICQLNYKDGKLSLENYCRHEQVIIHLSRNARPGTASGYFFAFQVRLPY